MAVTYGFYNSLNGDRTYNAEQMSAIFDGIITDGVFSSIGGALMTIAGEGMQVLVKTGKAWFNSTWTLNDAQMALAVDTADVSLTRIDAVVLEVNSGVSTRENSIKMVKGTPSANPTKPTMAADEDLHQYALAYITVGAGVTEITSANIEVNVGKDSCPFITSVLQQTSVSDLFNQWEAEFDAWFANIKAQLAGDVATNLQSQIDELKINSYEKATPKETYDTALDNKVVTPADLVGTVPKVGDVRFSTRASLGDEWVIANGAYLSNENTDATSICTSSFAKDTVSTNAYWFNAVEDIVFVYSGAYFIKYYSTDNLITLKQLAAQINGCQYVNGRYIAWVFSSTSSGNITFYEFDPELNHFTLLGKSPYTSPEYTSYHTNIVYYNGMYVYAVIRTTGSDEYNVEIVSTSDFSTFNLGAYTAIYSNDVYILGVYLSSDKLIVPAIDLDSTSTAYLIVYSVSLDKAFDSANKLTVKSYTISGNRQYFRLYNVFFKNGVLYLSCSCYGGSYINNWLLKSNNGGVFSVIKEVHNDSSNALCAYFCYKNSRIIQIYKSTGSSSATYRLYDLDESGALTNETTISCSISYESYTSIKNSYANLEPSGGLIIRDDGTIGFMSFSASSTLYLINNYYRLPTITPPSGTTAFIKIKEVG